MILKLESNEALTCEIFELMDELMRRSLMERKNTAFYGSIANTVLLQSDIIDAVNRFKLDANNFLNTNAKYIEFKILTAIERKTESSFLNFKEIIEAFKIINVDIDSLFEEILFHKTFVRDTSDEEKTVSVSEEWVNFLKIQPNSTELLKIVRVILSLQHSNVMSERIFSLMGNAWRKDRNIDCNWSISKRS